MPLATYIRVQFCLIALVALLFIFDFLKVQPHISPGFFFTSKLFSTRLCKCLTVSNVRTLFDQFRIPLLRISTIILFLIPRLQLWLLPKKFPRKYKQKVCGYDLFDTLQILPTYFGRADVSSFKNPQKTFASFCTFKRCVYTHWKK